MDEYFDSYADLALQRRMVCDGPRTQAFADAIAEVVKPGDTVIDVGAGTGILSMLAAKAGAKEVHGIEYSSMSRIARELIEKNGFADRITIHPADAHRFSLPQDQKADVIISEWLGNMAYVEAMLPAVLSVRERSFKPGGILLPSLVEVFLAPLEDKFSYKEWGPGFWKNSVQGFDFSHLEERELLMGHTCQTTVPRDLLLAEGQVIHHLDIDQAHSGDEFGFGSIEFQMRREGELNGFVGWFRAQLSPSVVLDTSPLHPTTHWQQTYFPFAPLQVKEGQKLKVHFTMDPHPIHHRALDITLRINEREIKYLVE